MVKDNRFADLLYNRSRRSRDTKKNTDGFQLRRLRCQFQLYRRLPTDRGIGFIIFLKEDCGQ
jgi:hypothetical protein